MKLIVCLFSVLLFGCDNPRNCEREAIVTSIIELQYRDAVIILDGKERRIVNQATLKVGDKFCADWSK